MSGTSHTPLRFKTNRIKRITRYHFQVVRNLSFKQSDVLTYKMDFVGMEMMLLIDIIYKVFWLDVIILNLKFLENI
ncbi:hypothetical protein, partial [Legionella norrlandica]|uniref:hypothetical protein n=1 Tax=Legionella norrlandica TaxID=1498499 RepID=UPI000560CD31